MRSNCAPAIVPVPTGLAGIASTTKSGTLPGEPLVWPALDVDDKGGDVGNVVVRETAAEAGIAFFPFVTCLMTAL